MTNVERFQLADRDLFDPRARRKTPYPFLGKLGGWIAVLAILAGIVLATYFYWQRQLPTIAPSATAPPARTPPAPAPATESAIRYPVPKAEPQSGYTEPLPALEQSDVALRNHAAELFGSKASQALFYPNEIVRRLVVTVDNLPRKKLSTQLLPVKPAAGPFLTTVVNGAEAMSAANDQRYAPYVALATGVDAKKLVAAYIYVYPLLQEEYRNLGYPSGEFNDRLIDAIDDLLATPDIAGPILLVQPKVMYQFADPHLEALSAGQKIMLRLGSQNAILIKTKLRAIRRELTHSAGAN
jgi:hypothetical protein